MLSRSLLIALAASLATAQVTTDCNPMEETNCPADPALGTSHNFNFNQSVSSDLWESYAGNVDFDPINGATFTIDKQGDSPTIRTKFYFFWGRTEVWLKAAPGKGIVSSMMWLSDDLDEVDWEFLGTNDTHASSNYFGKGVQDYANGAMHPLTGIHDDYHNYTTVWTAEKLEWWIDGGLVRTLLPADANSTRSYPQTPMRMSLGIWAGGDPSLPEGTRKWAGGDTDYNAGPYNMYIKSAMVSDYSTGKEYTYGDQTGSAASIQIVDQGKNSSAVDAITKPPAEPEKSFSEKWAAISPGGKIGIYSGGGAVIGLAAIAIIFYCVKQRRRGHSEAKLAAEQAAAEQAELEQFKRSGVDPDGFAEAGPEYDSQSMRYNGGGGGGFGLTTVASPLGEKGWNGSAAGLGLGAQSPTNSSYHDLHTPMYSSGGLGAPPPGTASSNPFDSASQRTITPTASSFNRPFGGGGPGAQSPDRSTFGMRSQSDLAQSQSLLMRAQSPGSPPTGGLPPTPSYNSRVGSPAPRVANGRYRSVSDRNAF